MGIRENVRFITTDKIGGLGKSGYCTIIDDLAPYALPIKVIYSDDVQFVQLWTIEVNPSGNKCH